MTEALGVLVNGLRVAPDSMPRAIAGPDTATPALPAPIPSAGPPPPVSSSSSAVVPWLLGLTDTCHVFDEALATIGHPPHNLSISLGRTEC